MNVLIQLFSEPWMTRLGWVLIYFIWQGAGMALFLAVALRVMTRVSSRVRYAVIGAALCICGIMPVATWMILGSSPASVGPSMSSLELVAVPHAEERAAAGANSYPRTILTSPGQAGTQWQDDLRGVADTALPYIVSFWFGGVLILTLRLILGWMLMQRLCRSGLPIQDSSCRQRFQDLVDRMRVSVPVRLLESALVEVPTLIGWLRPTILVPVSVLMGLTPDQLEAILAHELAHVRRYDYLVNFFQTLIETILFYHPAVWWISRKLREERENCCDDIALEVMQDRLVYASALAQIEETRSLPLTLTASGGSLLQRIRRIVGTNDRKAFAWPLVTLIIGILVIVYLTESRATEAVNRLSQNKTAAPTPPAGIQSQIIAAVREGNAVTVQKLIDQGADPKAIDKYGNTLLFDAGSPEVAEILIAYGVDPKVRNGSSITALSSLCLNGGKNTAAIARVLLQHGADPNSRDGEIKTTPIMGTRDGDTVDVLVQYGADLKTLDSAGNNALFWSTWQDLSTFEALLRHGFPFDARTDGPTVLLHATWNHNLPLVTWLLAHGVDPNSPGVWVHNHGRPDMMMLPICATAISGQPEAAKLLLDHGAKGEEATGLALQNHYSNIVKILWEHGVRNISELCYAISQNAPLSDMEKILQSGAPVDPPQDEIVTPLGEAAETDNLPAVQLLVQHGADVNKGGNPVAEHSEYHDTPLKLAAERGQNEIVAFLLQHGAQANPDAVSGAGNVGIPNSFYPKTRDYQW